MHFALVGNQNCGKTTLFNALTGSSQHVGNFPGVTVEKKEGTVRGTLHTLTDLPGLYSLTAYTLEETLTLNFLLASPPDTVINVADVTTLDRSLYLTLQLTELGIPTVLALNMMDELEKSGGHIDAASLSSELGLPVVPISASQNRGLTELISAAESAAKHKTIPKCPELTAPLIGEALQRISASLSKQQLPKKLPTGYAAVKLLEDGSSAIPQLSAKTAAHIDLIRRGAETALGTDIYAALADMRYSIIGQICTRCVFKTQLAPSQRLTQKLDSLFLHKFLSIPIFFGIMLLVFWLTFGVIGKPLSRIAEGLVESIIAQTDVLLCSLNIAPLLRSLITDGVLTGVGSVISFLPIITVLFFFLSLLEDSGYIARVAFVMDRLFVKLGISGRSLVPMLIGFGCSVPAIMATRTIPGSRDRKLTVMLMPFISCSAKLPIYAVFSAAFFPHHAVLAMALLYLFGIVLGLFCIKLLSKTSFFGLSEPFLLELPAYRLPSLKSLLLHIRQKALEFLRKAFTVILVSTMIIWFLFNFGFDFRQVSSSADSILAAAGSFIAPLFKPLGFGDWRAVSALIAGLSAKEMVVSTFSVLLAASSHEELLSALPALFSPVSTASFLVFTLLYTPCIAATNAMRRELGSAKSTFCAVLFQLAVAWSASFWVFHIGRLLFLRG